MLELPDELWIRILQIVAQTSDFGYRDLCCISISCRRFRCLSADDSLWSLLLSSHYPQHDAATAASSTFKTLYQLRFEKDKQRMLLPYRQARLCKDFQISRRRWELTKIEKRLSKERESLRAATEELFNLHKLRQASVALNDFQYREYGLQMEIGLCKQLIGGFSEVYKNESRRLDKAVEDLESMKYHPLQNYPSTSTSTSSGVEDQSDSKRKKLEGWDYWAGYMNP